MSLLFNTNNYAYVPYNAAMNRLTNALTVCCWVNFTTVSTAQMFINRMVSATPGNEWWSLNLYTNLRLLSGNATSVSAVSATSTFIANTWYQFAMTYASGVTNGSVLYQNAAQVASGTITNVFAADTTGIVLGANAQGAGDTNIQEFTTGYIEDMRVYERVLSVNELQTIYSADGRDEIYDGLLMRYEMNEGIEGSTASGAASIKDWGPFGMHATPYGSCVYGPSVHANRQLRR